MPRIARWLAAWCLAWPGIAPAQSDAATYEDAPTVFLSAAVPAALIRGASHRVLDEVEVRGTALEFRIESDYGSYSVRTLPMLALRVREVQTLAQAIDQYQRDNVKLADQLRGQLQVGGDSFVDILARPFKTTTSLVGQFTQNVGQTIDELGEGRAEGDAPRAPDEDSVYARLLPGDPVLASHKRNVASQLGLDVFSTNARVQEFLDTVARARSSGNQRAGMVTLSLPASPVAPVAGGAIDARIRAALNRKDFGQLYAHNVRLLDGAGIDPDLYHRFLGNIWLSPRHKIEIAEHLAFMEGVQGRGAVLEAALVTRSEEEALGYVEMTRMLARLHERRRPLRELVSGGHIPLAVTADGAMLVVLNFDLLYWDRKTGEVLTSLARYAGQKGYRGRELVVGGVLTELARRQTARLGYDVREEYFLRP